MDVRLPNGQVVRGVPDGMSKADLVSKLQSNGYDTSWYTPPEKSYARRALEEIPGAVEGSVRMLAGVPGYVGGGLAGASTVAARGVDRLLRGSEGSLSDDVAAGKAVMEGVQETLNPSTYLPEEDRTRNFQEIMGALSEKTSELGVQGGQTIGGEVGGLLGEVAAQMALNLAPIPGASAIGKIPRIGSQWKAAQALEAKRAQAKTAYDASLRETGPAYESDVPGAGLPDQATGAMDAVNRNMYDQAYTDLDNTMTPYPKNQQAPQFGFGGRIAKPNDTVGVQKPLMRDMQGQLRYDADMAEIAAGIEKERVASGEAAQAEIVKRIDQTFKPDEKAAKIVDDLLRTKRQAETEAAYGIRAAEEAKLKEVQTDILAEDSRPQPTGPTFLEQLEADLQKQTTPRIGPVGPGRNQRGSIGFTERRNLTRQLDDLREQIAKAKEPDPQTGLVDYQKWQTLGEEYTRLLKASKEVPTTGEAKPLGQLGVARKQRGSVGTVPQVGGRFKVKGQDEIHRIYGLSKDDKGRTWLTFSKDAGLAMPLTDNIQLLTGPQGLASGPGAKQRGGPKFSDFKRQMESDGIKLPDEVLRGIWSGEKKQKPYEPVTSVNEAEGGIISKIPGLDKEARELYMDDRTIDQLSEDVKKLFETGGRDAKGLALLPNSYRAAVHTITRWMNTHVNKRMDAAVKWGESLLIGNEWKGFKRVIAKDSPQGLWDQLTKDQEIAINDLGQKLTSENIAYSPDQARAILGRDILPIEERALKAMEGVGRQILGVMNAMRLERGKPPIEGRDFYWTPALWNGDYLYFIRDPISKEVVYVVGSHFRPGSFLGRAFNRKLTKALENKGVEFDKNSFKRVVTAEEFSLAGMEVLLEQMTRKVRNAEGELITVQKQGERFEIVRDTVAEVMADFSYGRARAQVRKGKPGYLGSEGGKEGLRNFKKVVDRMVTQASNMKANLELGKLYNEFSNAEAMHLFPKAREAAIGHLERSMGVRRLTKELDGYVSKTLDSLGLPPSLVEKLTRGSGNVATRLIMGFMLPVQLAVQVPQSMFAVPKSLQLAGRANGGGIMQKNIIAPYIVAKVLAKTATDILTRNDSYMLDLAKEGTFTPTMKAEYSGFGATTFGERNIHRVGKTLIGDIPQQFVEANVVRSPAARIFANLMDELGVTGAEKTRITKGLTEDYMVAWDRWKKAGWIANTGLVGDMFGRLQSFPTTWIGQFLEYSKGALTRGELLPLAAFLYINYVLGGLFGFVGVKDGDAAVAQINETMETDWTSPSEAIFEFAKSDEARYGLASAITGMNVGASMGAPSSQISMAPGLQLLAGVVKTAMVLWKYAFNEKPKQPGPEAVREAVRPLIPRVGHGLLEEPGNPLSDTLGTGSYKPGGYTDKKGNKIIDRNEQDVLARTLGTFSIQEAENKRLHSIESKTQLRIKKQRTEYVERLATHLMQGGKFDQKFLARARELEYRDPKDITRGVMENIYKKYLDPKQRAVRGGTSQAQQRAYQLYKRLEGDLQNARR